MRTEGTAAVVRARAVRWLGVVAWLAAAWLVTGCGGDATAPAVERNDPGTGTRTMLVRAEIEAKDEPAGFVTDFGVTLRDAQGAPISGAVVTVRNPNLGTVTLAEADPGDYVAQRFGFASGDYRLDVVRGADEVRGVVVGGIAAHAIVVPARNDTVPAGQPLVVRWTVPSEAAGADVQSRDYLAEGIPDTGSHTIPGSFLRARPDERIRVWRFNRVEIAGDLFGSHLRLEVRNTVEPVVVQ